ncbi:MAG: hypothetical protein ACE15C_04090 [Phycisphaerae bacterium]
MKRRKLILMAALGVTLLLTAVWSYQYMSGRREAAAAAQRDLADGRRMMGQIELASRMPAMAADRERLATETTSLIEQAARTAGIAPGSLRRISPEAPRRVGETVYKEKPTQVQLQAVSLKELVAFALAISGPQAGLNVDSMRLGIPREAGADGRWTAELVLTYLIYDPPQIGR